MPAAVANGRARTGQHDRHADRQHRGHQAAPQASSTQQQTFHWYLHDTNNSKNVP
jgi:hypothetical protein